MTKFTALLLLATNPGDATAHITTLVEVAQNCYLRDSGQRSDTTPQGTKISYTVLIFWRPEDIDHMWP